VEPHSTAPAGICAQGSAAEGFSACCERSMLWVGGPSLQGTVTALANHSSLPFGVHCSGNECYQHLGLVLCFCFMHGTVHVSSFPDHLPMHLMVPCCCQGNQLTTVQQIPYAVITVTYHVQILPLPCPIAVCCAAS